MSTDTKKLEGLVALEQALVKVNPLSVSNTEKSLTNPKNQQVPLEQFKRAFKTSQKHVEKEWVALATSAGDHLNKIDAKTGKTEDALKVVDGLLARFIALKKKLVDSKEEEALYTNRSRIRLQHLDDLLTVPSQESPAFTRWSKTQLDRILVDYMLREGCFDSAKGLAAEAGIEQLVDIELFTQSKMIEDALKKKSCAECLAWCKENGSALKKIKSNLEFNLRLQEYIELVRVQKLTEAIAYLKKHLTPCADVNLKEVQMAAALLAFDPETLCAKYRNVFDPSRWNLLITQFRANNCTINNLSTQPLLYTSIQAGMAALKTPQCYQHENKNVNCPICNSEVYGVLAEKLPNAHHLNSCLVCRISGDIMNEDNPPMVLPNGYVYSHKALEEMALKHDGLLTCPRTLQQFHVSQMRKAFAI
ncbi:UNVERIFIED_CONTAM: GID complex subunit containing RING finger motif [Siphonaria sp. JEL0065]|nr:GID complex subunit containing RING finger motif [Siphonaria sp. JEL0065]